MSIETKIFDFAQKMGVAANSCELVATTASFCFYALSFVDNEGLPIPIGLPFVVKVEGEDFTLISGDEALNLLDSLGIEE